MISFYLTSYAAKLCEAFLTSWGPAAGFAAGPFAMFYNSQNLDPPGGLPWAGMLCYYIATVNTQPSRKGAAPWEEVRRLFAEVRGK